MARKDNLGDGKKILRQTKNIFTIWRQFYFSFPPSKRGQIGYSRRDISKRFAPNFFFLNPPIEIPCYAPESSSLFYPRPVRSYARLEGYAWDRGGRSDQREYMDVFHPQHFAMGRLQWGLSPPPVPLPML